MKKLLSILTVLLPLLAEAQFAPSVGQLGTTAIHADSSIFCNWATGCSIIRGNQDISVPSIGLVSVGDSTCGVGKAGTNGVVSLGDGGSAILTFNSPIINGEGWDFAVFENSFSDNFLELAFVEVSSDGINFFQFSATSLTQDTLQVDGFGIVEATKIDNLAGKYRASYGTPFDLDELNNTPFLDINAITHIKITDVVGCINPQFASRDSSGHIINEPWPTPFPSGGFDLDAVGVIHQAPLTVDNVIANKIMIYPNPSKNDLQIKTVDQNIAKITLANLIGTIVFEEKTHSKMLNIDVSNFENGMYLVSIEINNKIINKKIIIAH